jgi:hypothetical protein
MLWFAAKCVDDRAPTLPVSNAADPQKGRAVTGSSSD